MSCFATVKVGLKIKATQDEIAQALKAMDYDVAFKTELNVHTGSGIRVVRTSVTSEWFVESGMGTFTATELTRQIKRVKIKNEAERQGYQITSDVAQGDKLVIRMKVM